MLRRRVRAEHTWEHAVGERTLHVLLASFVRKLSKVGILQEAVRLAAAHNAAVHELFVRHGPPFAAPAPVRFRTEDVELRGEPEVQTWRRVRHGEFPSRMHVFGNLFDILKRDKSAQNTGSFLFQIVDQRRRHTGEMLPFIIDHGGNVTFARIDVFAVAARLRLRVRKLVARLRERLRITGRAVEPVGDLGVPLDVEAGDRFEPRQIRIPQFSFFYERDEAGRVVHTPHDAVAPGRVEHLARRTPGRVEEAGREERARFRDGVFRVPVCVFGVFKRDFRRRVERRFQRLRARFRFRDLLPPCHRLRIPERRYAARVVFAELRNPLFELESEIFIVRHFRDIGKRHPVSLLDRANGKIFRERLPVRVERRAERIRAKRNIGRQLRRVSLNRRDVQTVGRDLPVERENAEFRAGLLFRKRKIENDIELFCRAVARNPIERGEVRIDRESKRRGVPTVGRLCGDRADRIH